MKPKNPGLFIPSMSFETDMENFEKNYDSMRRANRSEEKLLGKNLAAAGVGSVLSQAFKMSEELGGTVYFGSYLLLDHPNQLEYQKALQVIQNTTGLRFEEYTVPLCATFAPGLGVVTKSVCAFIQDNEEDKFKVDGLKRNFTLLQQILHRLNCCSNFKTELVLSLADGGFGIHGTSPLQKESSNIAFAWQNYLGKAFKAVAPMVAPMFYQTWSTNRELTEYFTQKGKELQKKTEEAYIAKIKASQKK